MGSPLALRHQYPVSPQRLHEVLADRSYYEAKLHAVGGPQAELVSWQQDERGVSIVLHQAVPGDAMPSFLRSLLPGDLRIRRTEIWRGASGSVEAVVDGAPGTITGVMRLEPAPDGCVLGAELTAEVPLPLIGGKVEKIVTDNIASLMELEYQFTLSWLRNPR